MNPNNNPSQLLQQGFHIAIGAVTALVETAQDPNKRAEAIADMQMELSQRTREWAAKGQTTELEARKVINDLIYKNSRDAASNSHNSGSNDNITNSAKPKASSGLQELQDDLVALRLELAKMREQEGK